MYILEKHGGRLPLRIRAVPEGTLVPYKNGRMQVYTCSICILDYVHIVGVAGEHRFLDQLIMQLKTAWEWPGNSLSVR